MTKEDSIADIEDLYLKATGPFPYESCRMILARADWAADGFIPDLDTYWSTIAGFCSSVRSIDRWSRTRIEQARELTAVPFFEQHPEHSKLLWLFDSVEAGDLVKALEIYERMRQALQHLVAR